MELGHYYEDIGDLQEAHIWYYNAAYETAPICDIHMGKKYPLQALYEVAVKVGLPEVAEAYQQELAALEKNN